MAENRYAIPTDLTALLGDEVDVSDNQAHAALEIVTAMAKAYVRGQGFIADNPNDEIRAVIVSAAARLCAHPRQIAMSETLGPQAVSYGQGFSGWSIPELFVLNRYRVQAQ